MIKNQSSQYIRRRVSVSVLDSGIEKTAIVFVKTCSKKGLCSISIEMHYISLQVYIFNFPMDRLLSSHISII